MGQAKIFKRLRKAVGWSHIKQGVRKYAKLGNTGTMSAADESRARYKDLKDAILEQQRQPPIHKTQVRCPVSGMLLTRKERARRREFEIKLTPAEIADAKAALLGDPNVTN